jgi:hypothetical protein
MWFIKKPFRDSLQILEIQETIYRAIKIKKNQSGRKWWFEPIKASE